MQRPRSYVHPEATEGQEGLLPCKKQLTCQEGSLTKNEQLGATIHGKVEAK